MQKRETNRPPKKRATTIAGRKTSVSLEDGFWDCLREIATERNVSATELIRTINSDRQHANLSSAIRLFVLAYYRDAKGRQSV
jgi:predicted DNA-binding ribbon-helix-helix protein